VNPLFQLEISWNLRYCTSNREVLSYHSLIVVGILSRVNILERIEVWIPSMKYSIKALSSLDFGLSCEDAKLGDYIRWLFLFPV